MFNAIASKITNPPAAVRRIAGEDAEEKAPTIDYKAYDKLATMIKARDLDMKTITGKIDISNILGATLAVTAGSYDVYLPANIYTGLLMTFFYTVSGGSTDIEIKQPFQKIIYNLQQSDGTVKTLTFDRQAIGEIQAFMLKSNSFKGVLESMNVWERAGGTVTALEQNVFLPTPGFLLDAPEECIPEMLLPIRTANASYIQFVFAANTTSWVDYTGGTANAITWSRTPELRVTKLSSARSKRQIFNYLRGMLVPVWNTRVSKIGFTPAGTSYTDEIQTPDLPSKIMLAGFTMAVTIDSDLTEMSPLDWKSFAECGLYQDEDNVLTGTTTALKLRHLNTFDTLPDDGQASSGYINPYFVASTNPFNIKNVASEVIDFGSSTDYTVRIPSISSGVTAAAHTLRVVIYEIKTMLY